MFVKQRTIEGIFIAGAAKRSAKRMVKQAIHENLIEKKTPVKSLAIGSVINRGGNEDLASTKRLTYQNPLDTAKEERFDIQKVNGAMEKQMRNIQSQIFKVWQKLHRIVYLDPQCVQKAFRLKFERT